MITRLEGYLKAKGFDVLVTKEPTDGRYGTELRRMLKNDKDPKRNAELCLELFVKDRAEHLKDEIEPFLKKDNSIVLCDRYYYSTIAFQHTQGVDIEKVIAENMAFRSPDIAFILDIPPETALKRIKQRGIPSEKFEQKEFMGQLRKNFLKICSELDDNIKVIDASGSKGDVFSQIRDSLDRLL
jgi:dTMP kinase